MRSRRAVGSLIGIGFLLMIIGIGVSYYNVINRIEDRSRIIIDEMQELDRDGADEFLDIQGVALTVGNSLNLTIKNTGNILSELEWVGVFDDTLNTQDYYRLDVSLNPVETQKDIGNTSIGMNPANLYSIQVLTKLGNIYYGEYPEPVTGGTGGGGGSSSQYYFVNTTGDSYAPSEFGSHSLFSAMQAGPDHINDTLTEQQSVFLGNIGDTIIDTLEFDPARGVAPYLFPITSEVHAVAYSGDGGDGFVTTFGYDGGAYSLDLEVDWIDLPSKTNEYLTIYGGAMGAETLRVDYWNGATWVNIIPSVTYEWNVVDVSAYLTGSSFTIRFVDSVQIGDTIENSWEVDVVYLHLFD